MLSIFAKACAIIFRDHSFAGIFHGAFNAYLTKCNFPSHLKRFLCRIINPKFPFDSFRYYESLSGNRIFRMTLVEQSLSILPEIFTIENRSQTIKFYKHMLWDRKRKYIELGNVALWNKKNLKI